MGMQWIKKFSSLFFVSPPAQYERSFAEEIYATNINSAFVMSAVGFVYVLAAAILYFIIKETLIGYQTLIMAILFTGGFLIVLYLKTRCSPTVTNTRALIEYLLDIILLTVGDLLVIIDHAGEFSFEIYLLTPLLSATVFIQKPKKVIYLYLGANLLMILNLLTIQGSHIYIYRIVTSVFVSIFAFSVSAISYRNRLQDFLNRKHIQEQAKELLQTQQERELSARKLAESETRLRAIFEGAYDAIIIFDEHGFLDCNPRTLELFNFINKEKFYQASFSDLFPTQPLNGRESQQEYLEHVRKALDRDFERFECVFYRQHSKQAFDADVTISSFRIGNETIFQATVRDITDKNGRNMN